MTANAPRAYGPVVNLARSLNNDYGVNQVAIPGGLNLLATMPVNSQRIGYVIQQQSVNLLTIAFDDGVSSTPTVLLLNGVASAGMAGDAIDMMGFPHYGRIRVYGLAGSPVALADW